MWCPGVATLTLVGVLFIFQFNLLSIRSLKKLSALPIPVSVLSEQITMEIVKS